MKKPEIFSFKLKNAPIVAIIMIATLLIGLVIVLFDNRIKKIGKASTEIPSKR